MPRRLDPERENKIIDILAKSPLSFTELLEESKLPRSTLARYLKSLEKRGLIRKDGSGKWSLTASTDIPAEVGTYLSEAIERINKSFEHLGKGEDFTACHEAWNATRCALTAIANLIKFNIFTFTDFSKLVEELYGRGIVDVRLEYCSAIALLENTKLPHLGHNTIYVNVENVKKLVDKIVGACRRLLMFE